MLRRADSSTPSAAPVLWRLRSSFHHIELLQTPAVARECSRSEYVFASIRAGAAAVSIRRDRVRGDARARRGPPASAVVAVAGVVTFIR